MKILVSQLGARHRYLIPQILFKNNLLGRLYTDSSCYSIIGVISTVLTRLGFKLGVIERLSKRETKLPREYVFSHDMDLINRFLNRKRYNLNKYEWMYQKSSSLYIKRGVGQCNVLYNMFFENIDFLKFCKYQGLKVVVDIYENPTGFKILENELTEHSEYINFENLKKDYQEKILFRDKYVNEILKLADHYTVPSKHVLDSLHDYENFDVSKTTLMPYPSSIQVSQYNYHPQKHKLIWVGNDPVRKGLIYCAKAATILKKKYPDLEFWVIGSINEEIQSNPTFSDLLFAGIYDKHSLINAFETSEAYVFPTLFEGFAGTVLEAASCGCPIITTENAGTDPDQFPAIYIPTRNVEAIVEAVETIFMDSNLRNQLSKKVFEYASNLTPESYEKELVNFFRSLE